jgi:hypothetical protein
MREMFWVITLVLAGCQAPMNHSVEAQQPRMAGDEIKAYFSQDRDGSFVASQGRSGKIVYNADGSASARPSGASSVPGRWSIEDNTFCTTWEDRPAKECFPMIRTGENEITVLNSDGSYRSTLQFGQ